jgi:hypothetical protein
VKKLKDMQLRVVPFEFRQHVYALHGQYLKSLPTPKSIDKPTIIEYVNVLNVEQQAKLVRASLLLNDAE